jgi:hypothetical protein
MSTIKRIDKEISFDDKVINFIGIRMKVRGSKDIEFQEGSQTGDMTQTGISVRTQEINGKLYGGCIDREETKILRDFLNECIELWEKDDR